MSIYNFKVNDIDGNEVCLDQYKGKVIIIVNTASKCGYTPQFQDLQSLYEKYEDKGLVILGFPCNQFLGQEPGSNDEVKSFCLLNYGVTFPMFEKVAVRGLNAIPLFNFLINQKPFEGFNLEKVQQKLLYSVISEKYPESLVDNSIKWNFTKFLIDREGNVINRFEPFVEPIDMEDHIIKLL